MRRVRHPGRGEKETDRGGDVDEEGHVRPLPVVALAQTELRDGSGPRRLPRVRTDDAVDL